MAADIIVLKFASAVLRALAGLPRAVHEIYRWYRGGWQVVVVVSEERTALLGIALDGVGVAARVLDPRDTTLTDEGDAGDGDLRAAGCGRFLDLLAAHSVVIVPGSDYSAVFLAQSLKANRCRLINEVEGVYEGDPAGIGSSTPRRFVSLGYADALGLAPPLVQPNAIRYLERHGASAEVSGLASPFESVIGRFHPTLTESCRPKPTSVLLLGLGTVGLGVYHRLSAMADQFRIIAALVRDRARYIAAGVPGGLLMESIDSSLGVRADVVVDSLPGLEPSLSLARQFLTRGVSVVSSNKILIADAGCGLSRFAARHGAMLLYSAAVGGSTPMLETVQREARLGAIRSIAGILNGTCNYVLDRCAEGYLPSAAVQSAQAHGFAQADPSEDMSGRDAARKLRILVRCAFGQELSGIAVEPLNGAVILRLRSVLKNNERLRVVTRAWKLGRRVFGQVQLEAVRVGDSLAETPGEWNRLIVTRANGEDVNVCGRGAGRWPTTEAVVADLLDFRLARYLMDRRSEGHGGRARPLL